MKYALIIVFSLILLPILFFKSCVIHNPKRTECAILTANIVALRAGPTFDIGFTENKEETFCINRGIESDLNLDSLKTKVLNKTVTLHLPKLVFGPSKHIAQLAIGDQIPDTRFK